MHSSSKKSFVPSGQNKNTNIFVKHSPVVIKSFQVANPTGIDGSRNSVSERPGFKQSVQNNLMSLPTPAREEGLYQGRERRVSVDDRPVNIHVHLPGVTCPACAYLEIANMQDEFALLPFAEALPLWLYNHTPSIHPNTLHYYKQYGNALKPFFGPMKLKDIGYAQVRGYQRWRSHLYEDNDTPELPLDSEVLTSKFRHAAGNVRIKNEINCVLKPMMREAGVWEDVEKKKFKHLPIPREGSGVPLDKEDKRQILEIAFSKKTWLLTAHCLRIEYRSGCGFGELRKVRRRDIDLIRGKVSFIEGAKNSGARTRTVTLTPSALESFQWLVARWQKLGGSNLNDYILPHRKCLKSKQFNRPMTSLHRSWVAIKKVWTQKYPDNAKPEARFYDGRKAAAIALLKNPKLSLPTIKKVLGWEPNSKLCDRYYEAEHDSMREALNTLEEDQ